MSAKEWAPVTSADVQRLIVKDRHRPHFVLENYTPRDWWENDVCEISNRGFWTEYEIKWSLMDFNRDKQKAREVFPRPYGERAKIENKWDLLEGTDRGPCRLFFVAPFGLIAESLVPSWAGLIEVVRDQVSGKIHLQNRVAAPRRHERKDPAIRDAMFAACYWRFRRLR